MSILKSEDSSKWINALVVIFSILCGFVLAKFLEQVGVWFDLEAKISMFPMIAQSVGVIVGVGTFVYINKNNFTSTYLNDVYKELLRVVWPTKDTTLKMTIGLVFALVIVAGIFVVVDFIFKKLLELVY